MDTSSIDFISLPPFSMPVLMVSILLILPGLKMAKATTPKAEEMTEDTFWAHVLLSPFGYFFAATGAIGLFGSLIGLWV